MMNSQNLQLQLPVQDLSLRGRSLIGKRTNKVMHHQCPAAATSSSTPAARGLQVPHPSRRRPRALVAVRAAGGSDDASGGESSSSSGGGEEDDDGDKQKYSSNKEGGGGRSSSSSGGGGGGGLSRDDLERLVGTDDDAKFNGLDLANLIRKKYGRSYDVTLIKKEFMGRNLLAMNVMWKYREQRSFPLSEEEYLLRLDDVANTLKCWGAVAHVRNTLEKLKESRGARALSALLSAYHDNRLYDRAVRAFNTLPAELGVKPGLVSHNVLLKALVASGDVAAARTVFDEMPDTAGVQPDIVSCNEILKGYLNAGDDAAFDQLVKEIAGPKRRFKPNVGTYNLRMALLCSKGRSFEAEELLDAMGANGVPPNCASFNTVIKGLCNEGEVGAAMALFKRMPEVPRQNGKGVSPNFETYIMLLEALVNKNLFDPALEVCKECLRNKWAPPFQAVKGLAQGLLKSRKAKHAREVLMAMRKAVKGDAKQEWIKVEAQFPMLLADKKA